jgi:type II secretory pathway pseudopilin PulG
MRPFLGAIIGCIVVGIFGMLLGAGNSYYTKKSQKAQQQQREIPLFGMAGAVLGLILGAYVGNFLDKEEVELKERRDQEAAQQAALHQQQQQHEAVLRYQLLVNSEKERKERQIDEAMGLDKIEDSYFQEGKCWKGHSWWIDPRYGHKYELVTYKKDDKVASEVNGSNVFNHTETSATKETIPRCHVQAKQYVVSYMRTQYTPKENG